MIPFRPFPWYLPEARPCRTGRALFVVLTLVLSALISSSQAASAAEPTGAERPNILFVYCDDHAYQAISAYRPICPHNIAINQTPNIDRLAREGIRFDNSYVTNSICGPCRAVVQTGKYSHKNGFYCNGNRFDGHQQTFPKILQEVGYQTAVVGKWHLGTHMAPQGYDYSEVLIGQGPYYNPPMLRNGERVQYTGYTTDIITDRALDWLQNKRAPDQPFMLMYQHKAPHRNWQPGPKYLTKYDDVMIPEPATLFDDYQGRGTPAKTQDMTIAETMNDQDLKLVAPRNLTAEQLEAWEAAYGPKNEEFQRLNLQGRDLVRWKYQRYMKDYLRCIAAVDDNLGRMLDYLDKSGLADNTVVIYTSDQGFYLGEHGWFDKRWMYEETLRTPLIVRWPKQTEPGIVNKDIVSTVDLAETFLDLAGAQVPGDMQGRSLVPLLKGRTPADWRKYFYYQYYEFPGAHDVRRYYGVTDGRFKLIHFYESDVDEWEFYDLQRDPYELTSVFGNPQYVEDRTRMEQELKRLRRELDVPKEDPPESYRGSKDRYEKAIERMHNKLEQLERE